MKKKKHEAVLGSIILAVALAATSGFWLPSEALAQQVVSKVVWDGKRYTREEFRKYWEENPGVASVAFIVYKVSSPDALFNRLESSDPVRKKHQQPTSKRGLKVEVTYRDNLGNPDPIQSPGDQTITIDEGEQVAFSMQKSQDWNVSATVGAEGFGLSASVTGSYGEVYSQGREEVRTRNVTTSETVYQPGCPADTYQFYITETPVLWNLWDLVQGGEDVGSMKVIAHMDKPAIKTKSIPARTRDGTEYSQKWSELAPLVDLIRKTNPREADRLEQQLRLQWAKIPCSGGSGYWIIDDFWQMELTKRQAALQAATQMVSDARKFVAEVEKMPAFLGLDQFSKALAQASLQTAIATETKARKEVAEAERNITSQ